MITFTDKDYDKQFISINTDDSTRIDIIIKDLMEQHPELKSLHIIFDKAEILIPIESGISYGFSLKELREHTNQISTATVSYFAVDLDKPSQRFFD